MNEYVELRKKVNLLEYHQTILLKLITNPNLHFFRLVIERGLSELEVNQFLQHCEDLSKKMEKQKAEGFVHFHPLFIEFSHTLSFKLDVKEVVTSCLKQQLYEPLFTEFNKYIQ